MNLIYHIDMVMNIANKGLYIYGYEWWNGTSYTVSGRTF
jgi:hypothetical protein